MTYDVIVIGGGPAGLSGAVALCRALRGCPEVRQAYYLSWQPGARIYSHEGSGQQLPPGQGDPLEASDERLAARLAEEGRLSLQELRRLDGWLAGRLRRAAISHGQAFDLALAADQRGLLLVEVHEGVTLDWLGWVHELLAALLGSEKHGRWLIAPGVSATFLARALFASASFSRASASATWLTARSRSALYGRGSISNNCSPAVTSSPDLKVIFVR